MVQGAMAVSINGQAGKNPGAAKPCLRTFTAGLEAPGRSRRNTLATLAWSSVPSKSHKAVSEGPALEELGGRRWVKARSERLPRVAG